MNIPKNPENNDNNKSAKQPINRRLGFWVLLLFIVIIIADIKQNAWRFPHHENEKKPVPVVLSTAQQSDVPIYISALGTVTPTYTVTIKTQVNGTLLNVLFREGQTVKKGDLLAEIDSRPYEAQLQQYEGQLARDQALLANANIDLARYQKLWRQNSIAQQTLATQQSLVKQDEGNILADQGLIATVKVNLLYCKILSPIDGRVGLRLVDPGNVVLTSDTTGIVVVNTLDPITVIFSIPQDNVPSVMQQINAGKILTVNAYDRAQNKLLATGTLLTIDNQIDPTTGTVKLKAQFDNPQGILFPSQFVNIQLLVNTLHNVVVIPTAAIQYSTSSPFVYLLNPKTSTVNVKPITVGITLGNNTSVTGLNAGQSVVIDGADKLTDGATVTTSLTTAKIKQHRRIFA